MKRLPYPILTLLLIFLPVMGKAQTPSPRPVAVMPFTGETDAVNDQFRAAVTTEIRNLPGNFPPSPQNLPPGVSAEDIPPDEPPPSSMVGGRQYVVTGASFPDEGEHHLQVWLWDVEEPTLIYTDELVCEEVEDADEFMALLIEWVFSHVPDPAVDLADADDDDVPWVLPPLEPAEETVVPRGQRASAPVFEDEDKWFYLGGRLGGSIRQYSIPDNPIRTTGVRINDFSQLTPSFEGALHATLQMLPFLALQAEAMFTMDFVSLPAYNNNVRYDLTLNSMSLMFPLLVKVTLKPVPFLVAPYGGAFYIMPLGPMEMTNPINGTSASLKYERDLPIGWIAGLTLGVKMERFKKGLAGRLFADIRYSGDFGKVTLENVPTSEIMNPFSRNMLSVSIGYEVGLANRDVKATARR